jgi:hypothetical protein
VCYSRDINNKELIMKIITTTINYMGIEIEVTAEVDAGEARTWDEPGYPAEAVLMTAEVGGVDVMSILSQEQQTAIEAEIVEEVMA